MPFGQCLIPGGLNSPTPAWGVEMGFLPKDNKNTFNVTIELPVGTPVEALDRAVRDTAAEVTKIPEVVNWQSWAGLSGVADFNSMMRMTPAKGSEIGAVRVNLTDKNSGRRSSIEIARELRTALRSVSDAYPGSTIQVGGRSGRDRRFAEPSTQKYMPMIRRNFVGLLTVPRKSFGKLMMW